MQIIEEFFVFFAFFLYFTLYKIIFLDSLIYLEIRKNRSKSYIKKNKSTGNISKLFYINFKNDFSRFYFYQNIIIVFIGLICIITSFLSFFITKVITKYVLLFVFPFFYLSMLNWEIVSTLSRIKNKSKLLKALIILLYSVLTFFIMYQIVVVFLHHINFL